MRRSILVGICLAALGIPASTLPAKEVRSYKEYVPDYSPLESDPALSAEYHTIFNPKNKDTVTRDQLKRAYEIIDIILRRNPKWIDGYWLLGSVAFQWGGSYTEEKDLPFARTVLVRGQQATENCLKIDPNQFLCKLFLGSALGSIGTIDGVLSSLVNAKHVERLWNDVVESEYNFHFFANVSAQGSVRYGLGIFYRLVPDMTLLKWLFGVRGNIDRSIELHREGISLDGDNTCSRLMLAVSLVCKGKGDFQTEAGAEGLRYLRQASQAQKDPNLMMQICAKDALKVIGDGNLACGYATAKQQEVSEEAVEKSKLKK